MSWLASLGFPTTPASYPIVDVVDDGIDTGNANNVLHPDFHYLGALNQPSRVAYIGNCTSDPAGDGLAGHGNLNAGIVASYNNLTGSPHVDGSGYRIGLGISPFGRMAGTKIFANNGSTISPSAETPTQAWWQASYNAGADLTSNSWGAATYGAYDSSAQAYDALTRDASAPPPATSRCCTSLPRATKAVVVDHDLTRHSQERADGRRHGKRARQRCCRRLQRHPGPNADNIIGFFVARTRHRRPDQA